MKVPFKFNFRKISADKLSEQLSDLDTKVDVAENFDVIDKDANDNPKNYRRKPVEVELTLPEWTEQLPKLAQEVIKGYVGDFVKANYIDNFLPVGDHSWETIEKEAAKSRSGSARITVDDDTLKAAADSFGSFITQTTGHEVMGERISAAAKAKFSQNAITRQLGECTPQIIDKLQARLDQWATHLAESGSDEGEELADAYTFLTSRLDKVKAKMTTDVAELIKVQL